jgi:CheY-like chemotaxis protein
MDSEQLDRVLFSLVSNAREAMPNGGVLTLRCERIATSGASINAPSVAIDVEDTGQGMSDEMVAQAFEPFVLSSLDPQGAGLVLAAAKGIVEQSGGSLALTSKAGTGSRFRIEMPLIPGEAVVLPTQPSSVAPPASCLKVLVAEDDPAVRSVVRRVLHKMGHQVTLAEDGQTAFELAQHTHFDLLVTDVRMPRCTGPQLARLLWEQRPNLPVLFMSGYAGEDALPTGSAASGFLAKPFSADDLISRVATVSGALPAKPGVVSPLA